MRERDSYRKQVGRFRLSNYSGGEDMEREMREEVACKKEWVLMIYIDEESFTAQRTSSVCLDQTNQSASIFSP